MQYGYCPLCHKYVAIRPGKPKRDGDRAVHWYPCDHNGEPCVASGAEPNLSRFDEETNQHIIGCSGCDAEWPQHELSSYGNKLPPHAAEGVTSPRCPGTSCKI